MAAITVTYLDTHVVVWLYSGEVQLLSKPARKQIERDDVIISPAVLLELQYLYEIKRIKQRPEPIAEALHDEIGMNVCNLPFPEVIRRAILLTWIRDPFDRLIVAQAVARDAPLISKDERIRKHFAKAVW